MPRAHDSVLKQLKTWGLALPGVALKSPWPEHEDLAVNGKTVAFMSVPGVPLAISLKLPVSREQALAHPFASPTGYGLGKSGWVTLRFAAAEKPPVDLLKKWILESYRAVAPKKLVKALEAQQPWTRSGVAQ